MATYNDIKKIKIGDNIFNLYDSGNDDTKNTTGSTNKTASKMYLVAATSQADNPITYSNTNCYIGTDNCLYSGGTKVLTNAVTALSTTAGSHTTKTSATGAVSIAIPTMTSHLSNDSGFITVAAQIVRW